MISLVEEHGFQITAVCEYLKVSRTAYYRSIRARKAERDVEKRGRPPALSLQRRNELADEITKRHQNGLTMTTAQVILEVQRSTISFLRFYVALTSVWTPSGQQTSN